MLTTASKKAASTAAPTVFRKPALGNNSKKDANIDKKLRMDDGINLDDLRRSMAEAGLGDVSIGENTFSSVVKALDSQQHSHSMGMSEDTMSVDTTMLLNDYNPRHQIEYTVDAPTATDFIPDPQGSPLLERQRLQEYCRRQLEALTCIRKQVLRDEQDTLDMTELNKFQFWNRMLQKERQLHAEEVAELKLQIRELQTCLDEIMDVIYLVPPYMYFDM